MGYVVDIQDNQYIVRLDDGSYIRQSELTSDVNFERLEMLDRARAFQRRADQMRGREFVDPNQRMLPEANIPESQPTRADFNQRLFRVQELDDQIARTTRQIDQRAEVPGSVDPAGDLRTQLRQLSEERTRLINEMDEMSISGTEFRDNIDRVHGYFDETPPDILVPGSRMDTEMLSSLRRIDDEVTRITAQLSSGETVQGMTPQQLTSRLDELAEARRNVTNRLSADPDFRKHIQSVVDNAGILAGQRRVFNGNLRKAQETARILSRLKNKQYKIPFCQKAQSCIPPDPSRAKYGFATPVVEAVKRYLGRTPTTGDMRNVLRNLGVDDARALDLKRAGSNKKFFGRNIDEIKEWNQNKGSVPSQTIVKKAMPDGSVRHYMSRQKTSLEPTRWVESDGKIMPNPDWDMVGENVTFGDGIPQLYVRTGKATYRRAEAGEDGVFLNIQRPHRGENLSRDQILDMEVDAFEISPGNYRLVHESTQAIDPQRVAERQSRDAFFKYSEKANPSQRELDEIADEAGIGRPIGYTLGGAMLGGALDDEGNEGAWLGGALGAMLGSRRMRSVVKKSFTGRKSKDLDQHAIDIDNLEAEQALNREIVGEGYAGRLDDVEEKKRFIDHVLTPIKAAREGGRGIANLILNNPVLGSGFSVFMQAKNSPTAKKLYGIMERSAAAPNAMYRRYSENLVEQFGERGWREASARQVNEIRRIMGDESISEEEALDRFGETIFRAITYRADVEDGVLRYDSRGNRVYANDDLRQMDEAIMATDTGRRMKRALQDTFDGIADNQIEALNTHP